MEAWRWRPSSAKAATGFRWQNRMNGCSLTTGGEESHICFTSGGTRSRIFLAAAGMSGANFPSTARKHVHINWDWLIRELQTRHHSPFREGGVSAAGSAWNARRKRLIRSACLVYQQVAAAFEATTSRQPSAKEVHLLLRVLHRERRINTLAFERLQALAAGSMTITTPTAGKAGTAAGGLSPAERLPSAVKPRFGPLGGPLAVVTTWSHKKLMPLAPPLRLIKSGPGAPMRTSENVSPTSITDVRPTPNSIAASGALAARTPAGRAWRRGTSSRAVEVCRVTIDGPSTLVTRSIGDWDAARACVPQPDISRFELRAGGHARVILASDGLWDFLTTAQAVEIVRSAASAQQAANRLGRLALQRSNAKYERLKDDVSVIVVDVDLRSDEARVAAPPPPQQCCVVS